MRCVHSLSAHAQPSSLSDTAAPCSCSRSLAERWDYQELCARFLSQPYSVSAMRLTDGVR